MQNTIAILCALLYRNHVKSCIQPCAGWFVLVCLHHLLLLSVSLSLFVSSPPLSGSVFLCLYPVFFYLHVDSSFIQSLVWSVVAVLCSLLPSDLLPPKLILVVVVVHFFSCAVYVCSDLDSCVYSIFIYFMVFMLWLRMGFILTRCFLRFAFTSSFSFDFHLGYKSNLRLIFFRAAVD